MEVNAGTDVCTSARICLYLERERSSPPGDLKLNPLDKGKRSSTARYRAFSEDIDRLVDRPESCVDLQSQAQLLKAVMRVIDPYEPRGPPTLALRRYRSLRTFKEFLTSEPPIRPKGLCAAHTRRSSIRDVEDLHALVIQVDRLSP